MDAVIVPTYGSLTHVAMAARPYPTHLLQGCETGLVLFAAAFVGHNDAIHFAEANVRTTCVDIDGDRLWQMRQLYPLKWSFVSADAWYFATTAQQLETQYDGVSADTFTGDAMRRSLSSLDLWCSIARKFVTATITDDVEDVEIPEGWTASLYPRSDSVSWLVLERD